MIRRNSKRYFQKYAFNNLVRNWKSKVTKWSAEDGVKRLDEYSRWQFENWCPLKSLRNDKRLREQGLSERHWKWEPDEEVIAWRIECRASVRTNWNWEVEKSVI